MWFNPTMIWLVKSRWARWDLWLRQGWCKHSVNYGAGRARSSRWSIHLGLPKLLLLFAALLKDMILAGVPANKIAGHPYAFTAAMNGEVGVLRSTIVWVYMFGIGLWTIILGTIAIQRVQRIPWRAAAFIMTFSYILWFYAIGGMVAR